MDTSLFLLTAVFGLIIGSFLTACIFRIPYGRAKGAPDFGETEDGSTENNAQDEQIEEEMGEELTLTNPPRSFCPHCRSTLAWYHNIPLISFLILRGKCAFCSQKIPLLYPLAELLSASFAILTVMKFGVTFEAFIVFLIVCSLIVISAIDIDYYIIPDRISWPLFYLAIILARVNEGYNILPSPFAGSLKESFDGVLAGAGFLYAVALIYEKLKNRPGLGLGDVKLLAFIGAFFGVSGALYTIIIGSILGSIFGLAILLLQRKSVRQPIPFGPYLAIGAILYMFSGGELLVWLFSRFYDISL